MRQQLSISKKKEIIAAVDSGKKKKDIAIAFAIKPSTLSTILKDRIKVEKHTTDLKRKKVRAANFEDIDKAVFAWFRETRSKNIPISGPLIQEKAKELGKLLGHLNFKASTGWLNRFRNRFEISSKVICGEEAAVPLNIVQAWRASDVKKIISEYCLNDIFNADETGTFYMYILYYSMLYVTGMFYKLLPDRTLALKNDPCRGGKRSKERLTALLCCNASGTEKLRPLIIGKSIKPRCFKNVKFFPCEYAANNSAWISAKIFSQWLIKLDKTMQSKNRKILLIIDNCSAHNNLPQLSNIRIMYLPPHCTAVLQPLDLGVIQNAKVHYRKSLLRKAIVNISCGIKEFNITIKDAIEMIYAAWSSVTDNTINKCWKKSGIIDIDLNIVDDSDCSLENNGNEDLWSIFTEKSVNTPSNLSFNDYVEVDFQLLVANELTDDQIIKNCINDLEAEDESDDENKEQISDSEALVSFNKMKDFLTNSEIANDKVYDLLKQLECVLFTAVNKKNNQSKITDYFKT